MKYFIGFLVSIGLIILAFIFVLNGFGGGSDKPKPTPLADYANSSRTVQFTMQGPVNADENHKAVRITVGKDRKDIAMLQGYNDTVTQSYSYNNNETAYAEFLRALELNGFTKGNPNPEVKDDRGYCSTGYRYTFEIFDGSQTVQRFWSATCGKGNFGGNVTQLRLLFQNQIPDYRAVTAKFVL